MDEVEPRGPEDAPVRVVSLLPSATEIVCALGAERTLVGISHECDHPETIRGLPVLTRSRVSASGTSLAIDTAVRAVVRDALSIYTVDEAQLAALSPEVIVTQDLCEVCAVSLDDVRSAVARLAHRDAVRIVSLTPTCLDDILADVETVAAALHLHAQGHALRRALAARLDAIAQRAATAPTRPRVVSVEWLEPIMLGGLWMPELIAHAGGVAAGARAAQPAPTVTPEDLARLDPEVVLIKPCGFTLERTLEERGLIARAIQASVSPRARVYVTDGNAYFNRPGPRIVESLEILAACVHPELFDDLARKHAAVIHPLDAPR
ncbi:ABC transporter substrate-binding protein [Chondromyces apiculatus]|uniref:Fe/B12 periplasmic-binding domain-containing protein n=1 Tax=Chondromyces apiculatus DSM 436 TaxID=1192034 RepID=A0A017T7D9_9BACT|nr:ABC transporter substrate-binding protein [Chondromyces apiculatus]EYF05139.1 Hypothetical protein CAP_3504 [Chondromyces apiculatus DSM 436]